MANKTLDINLIGRTFTIACPSGQEQPLLQAAEILNERLSQLKQKTHNANLEQLAITSALNLVHELTLLDEQKYIEKKQLQERIKLLQNTLEQALSDSTQKQLKKVDEAPVKT